MKVIIRKLFWDFEKEERWLNEKAQQGLALIEYSWGKYTFEECKDGEFIYRLEMLQKDASEKESREYIRFVEESGVECVSCYMRWVFFRRRAEDGPFEMFSDNKSKIEHLKGIRSLYGLLFFVELFFSFFTIKSLVTGPNDSFDIFVCVFFGGLLLGTTCLMGRLASKMHKRIKELQKEKNLYE